MVVKMRTKIGKKVVKENSKKMAILSERLEEIANELEAIDPKNQVRNIYIFI
jgi:hypothetical protein